MADRSADERRTFGRGGTGAGWTAGQRESTRSNARGRRPAAALEDLPQSVVRQAIADQWCPWCDRGEWRSLPVHTAWAHGITADDLRAMAGFLKGKSTVSAVLSEQMSTRPQSQPGHHPMRTPRGQHRVISEAGLAAVRERNRRQQAAIPAEERRARMTAISRASAPLRRKPTPCTWCGAPMPKSTPRTCSPECRREVRRQTARLSAAKVWARPPDEVAVTRAKISAARRARDARH